MQISIQDSEEESADHIAGYEGASARKRALAAEVVKLGLPLTINMVVHRANIGRIEPMVELALALGAARVEIAHVQYYGWALKNRAALMPSREQVEQAVRQVELLRTKHHGRIVIDAVVPDYYARFPKPCVGGWGRRSLNVTPAGKVLPCHAAEVIPGLEFWTVREHSLGDIWRSSPAFAAFRGTDWMQEPCKSCARRETGFRRLPLPGLPDRGRRPRRRSGLPSVAASCAGRAIGRRPRGSSLQLPAFLTRKFGGTPIATPGSNGGHLGRRGALRGRSRSDRGDKRLHIREDFDDSACHCTAQHIARQYDRRPSVGRA